MNFSNVEHLLGTWGPKMQPFIESSDFDEIFRFLKKESKEEGKTICPEWVNTFRAFKETPYDGLKCIFLLQDPYPWIKGGKYVADGIAMSCSITGVCQPSLTCFYEGMSDDLGIDVFHNPDLTYLCKQGVLFLNTSLTVELNKPTSHQGIWNKFMDFLMEEAINFHKRTLCYVSFGADAQVAAKAIVPFIHWGFEVEHPAYAHRRDRMWKHDNIFSKINKVLKDNMEQPIKWNYEPES
jgi:uracil-DNA glycosylase